MRYASHVSSEAPKYKALSLKESLMVLKSKRKKGRRRPEGILNVQYSGNDK